LAGLIGAGRALARSQSSKGQSMINAKNPESGDIFDSPMKIMLFAWASDGIL
jgi:hypothetical protein